MIFQKDYMQQFRDADADGTVGLRGYMNFFQDMATNYMHNLGKGNDTLPEEYGICWMYTKYRMHVEKQADFTAPLHMETWVEKEKPSIRLNQDLEISRNGELFAVGRVESCLYNMNTGKLCRIADIDYPFETESDRELELSPFTRMKKDISDMEYCYSHMVRYTDLDKSRHMNNLLYINLFLNAFDSAFFEKNKISDFEIHYLNQCFEGEEIRVYQKAAEEGVVLAGEKPDGTLAVQGILFFKKNS